MFVDLALLDEKISKINKTVKELDNEVSSFVALLEAARDRLHKAQRRKEQLIDDKQRLLNKKIKFLESNPIGNPVSVKRSVSIKSRQPSADVEVDPDIKTLPGVLSSYSTYVGPAPAVPESRLPKSLPLSLGLFTP